jgi:hypothetical protein
MSNPSLQSSHNLKFWLPVGLGTIVVGAGVGSFLGSINLVTGIIPTVATGMMLSFVMGGLASWLNSKTQATGSQILATIALGAGVWAGAVNLAIAAALAPMAIWCVVWPEQTMNWVFVARITATIGSIAGGVITGMVLTQSPTPAVGQD